MKANKLKSIMTGVFAFGMMGSSFAQEAAQAVPFSEKYQEQILVGAILLTLLLVFFTVLFLFSLLMGQIQDVRKEILQEQGRWKEEYDLSAFDRFWAQFANQMTDAVPVENEEEIDLNHDYDGIRELDNNLPPWWKGLFYVSIIWAIGYLFHYHVLGNGKLQLEEYETEMAEAELAREEYLKKAANLVDENNVTVLTDAGDLAKGKSIFELKCSLCHRKDGGGEIGPNLTDEYWINGGGISNIFSVIKYGRTQKGMISWQGQLKPQEMQQVASYIVSLKGSNPTDPKKAEGEIWVDESAPASEVSDSTAVDASEEVAGDSTVTDVTEVEM